jgi:hypothetical protein
MLSWYYIFVEKYGERLSLRATESLFEAEITVFKQHYRWPLQLTYIYWIRLGIFVRSRHKIVVQIVTI